MMAVWPSGLPAPRIQYAAAPLYQVLVSDRAEPIVNARRRFASVEHVLDVEWAFGAGALAVFREFFTDTLDNGARAFKIALAYRPGEPVRDWVARFDDELVTEYTEPATATVRARLRLLNEV